MIFVFLVFFFVRTSNIIQLDVTIIVSNGVLLDTARAQAGNGPHVEALVGAKALCFEGVLGQLVDAQHVVVDVAGEAELAYGPADGLAVERDVVVDFQVGADNDGGQRGQAEQEGAADDVCEGRHGVVVGGGGIIGVVGLVDDEDMTKRTRMRMDS